MLQLYTKAVHKLLVYSSVIPITAGFLSPISLADTSSVVTVNSAKFGPSISKSPSSFNWAKLWRNLFIMIYYVYLEGKFTLVEQQSLMLTYIVPAIIHGEKTFPSLTCSSWICIATKGWKKLIVNAFMACKKHQQTNDFTIAW